MQEPTFEEIRKQKQSIRRKSSRRKSRKSSAARRQSKRLSRKPSIRGSLKKRGLKGSKNKSTPLWDEDEPNLNEVMPILSGEPLGESPIDLELSTMKKLTCLPPLQWLNTENKSYLAKIANTGRTATITGLWSTHEYPVLRGGPLVDEFRFSQMHFHWGETEKDGSEHSIVREHYPFEIHAVFHNSIHGSHERARKDSDGIIVIVYFCSIASDDAEGVLQNLANDIDDILVPPADRRIQPFSYADVLPVFTDDYILYKGWIKNKCKHATLWFICRQTLAIGKDQLAQFRRLLDFEGKPILRNYRDAKELGHTKIFIVDPSIDDVDTVLHPRPEPSIVETVEVVGEKRTTRASKNQGRMSERQSKLGKRLSMKKKSSIAHKSSKVGQRKSKIAQRKSKIGQRKSKIAPKKARS
ncbi:Carb_anhydrase [Nesidiocoris tenuis]|uniref:Carbonic anhydrase n=1 Tax=Nesidiocoris tenuis TaxID=355587 RepID=A0ABN7ATF5_9HEMI|nr:Carb_anhydrase [Nesidiocoris tenuis]